MHSDAIFWDKLAEKYARATIKDGGGYQRTLRRASALLRPDHRVLEIGCGTASTALRLASGTGPYLATDLSAEMVRIGVAKSQAAGLPNLTVQQADIGSLAESGAQHDAVLAFNMLHLVRDLPTALQQIAAMLPPGGLFLSKTPCVGDMARPIRWAIRPMQLIGKAPHVLVFTAGELRNRIEAAGFRIEALEYHGSTTRDTRPVIVARRLGLG